MLNNNLIFLVVFLSIVISKNIYSKNNEYVYPTIYIASIKAKTNKNSNQDELFVEVAEFTYKNQTPIQEYRIPGFPSYWIPKTLSRVKDLPIWKGIIKTGETKVIHVHFKDQDFWNKDDLIGLIKIKMNLVAGIINSEWEIINSYKDVSHISIKDSEHIQKIHLSSDKAVYKIELGISETKKLSIPKINRPANRFEPGYLYPYGGIIPR